MRKKILPIQIAIVLTVIATVGALTALAGEGPLVLVSGTSPFGELEECGNFPGTIPAPGIVSLDSEVEPWVVVNPTDSDNIVAFWQQDRWSNGGARGNVAGVSFDGGGSWVRVPVPWITDCTGGPWERASDPWLSFGLDGTLHQMSLVFDIDPPEDRPDGFGPNGMAVSKSTDGGLTWSEPIIILIEDTKPRFLDDKNTLTADPTDPNYVYAVWDRLQLSGGDIINPEDLAPVPHPAWGVRFGYGWKGPIYFARSTDGGETWEKARKIYETGGLDQTIGNQIVVLPDGTVIDFFTELLNVENSDHSGRGYNFNLALLRSTNKGKTWRPRGRPVYAARIISYGAVTPDDRIPVRDASILFDLAVDPNNGSLYAVWQDVRFNGIEEVAFTMSTDGGFTWSEPIKVNQTPTSANPLRQQAFLPSVEVAGGTVGVTYYDFRNDDDTGELADHWFVSCAENCSDLSSWGGEIRLTASSFDYLEAPFAGGLFLGDYVGLASDGTDFLAVFTQPHDSDPSSVFFRRISLP
jgi:hypothetical protein